ncbi:MAG: ATP-binding protein [Gemmatimonadetes bacterium]|nr:ATP-binding protein [Gemmatimonadota bacterium]MXX72992.1 ATP-binding protein [Gemmatimonadota bacterium]MYC90562.1 ATP-binding protein [Gemmatimonadota bacterium]MYG36408.1 ATP-binding protein [Gemmatimonadota bacterium]
MFKRSLPLPDAGTETFFLWGPRQAGKSTLLREHYPDARWIDLLKSDEFRRYLTNPEYLRQEIEAEGFDRSRQVVVDEIQKVPALLDEVHWLMENRGVSFALCGSSATKVKRGAANLLGGRAIRYELLGITARELTDDFDLTRLLNTGYLPRIYQAPRSVRLLDAYINDYLVQEVAAEGVVRKLPAFSRFLDAASLSDGEVVNVSNIAAECGVSQHTAKNYFQVLVDMLLARWVPSYRSRPKRRVIQAPKFYFADVGIVNRLARRGPLASGSELYGKAFENWVCHELSAWLSYRDFDGGLSYWRLAGGTEVDFIVGNMLLAVEAKASPNIGSRHLRGLRSVIRDHPSLKRRVIVCLEARPRRTRDGIDILPAADFVRQLWDDRLVSPLVRPPY